MTASITIEQKHFLDCWKALNSITMKLLHTIIYLPNPRLRGKFHHKDRSRVNDCLPQLFRKLKGVHLEYIFPKNLGILSFFHHYPNSIIDFHKKYLLSVFWSSLLNLLHILLLDHWCHFYIYHNLKYLWKNNCNLYNYAKTNFYVK